MIKIEIGSMVRLNKDLKKLMTDNPSGKCDPPKPYILKKDEMFIVDYMEDDKLRLYKHDGLFPWTIYDVSKDDVDLLNSPVKSC